MKTVKTVAVDPRADVRAASFALLALANAFLVVIADLLSFVAVREARPHKERWPRAGCLCAG